MKKLSLFLLFFIYIQSIVGQGTFKTSLSEISKDICSKLVQKNKKKVVVLFITDLNKTQTSAGKYMADVVSYYVVNDSNGFSVFDRENLSGIAEAKKLIAEGYVDPAHAKELGKMISVEAIIVGNYTILANSLSLTLKALDVNDGFVIAQSLKEIAIDKDVSTLLGIASPTGNESNMANKGFNNRPLNSNESYNNPETVNKDCIQNKTGDFCFTNETNFDIRIHLRRGYYSFGSDITLKPFDTKCIYEKSTGSVDYEIKKSNAGIIYSQGQIYIEQCKSKTLIIK